MGAAARLVLGLGVLTAVRLLLAGATDLIPDEAYYDYWSRSLDVCYWDQPGGVAAWNALVRAVFGGGVFAVRLGAIVLSLVTSYFAYDLGRVCLGDRMRAANGVLLAQILPLLSVGAILMLHDALLGACAAMTLAFAARATIGGRPEWWYAAGAAFAAAMYAKFSAVLLAPGLLLFLILSPSDRRHLRRREPYLAGLLAAFLFSPVIFWNMRHGWIALLAVAKLATKGAAGFLGSVGSLAEFIGSQFGLVIPIIFVFMLLAARATWKNRRDEDARGHFFSRVRSWAFSPTSHFNLCGPASRAIGPRSPICREVYWRRITSPRAGVMPASADGVSAEWSSRVSQQLLFTRTRRSRFSPFRRVRT
ncbi:MAG: glycosyltransferase family 39 protein [Deltaproteobacteria bacterium]|nr:glycosyltransferase family 39 protein [Deltaproteobacteria bacterium]